jgi:hypothetical protein
MNFLDYYLQYKITSGNVPQTSTSTEFSLTDPGQTQMGKAEQLEGENTSHDQEMEGGWSKKQQPYNRGGKRLKLTADGIDKQYLESLKQIGQRLDETSSDGDNITRRPSSCNETALSVAQNGLQSRGPRNP